MIDPGTFLDWALLTVSSFNTLLPLWLGLTVLLNAERRTWGLWVAGISMLLTSGFFALHTAMLEGHLLTLPLAEIWWYSGWLSVVGLPFAWYVAMLWFVGFWEPLGSPTRRRHTIPAIGLAILAVVVLVAVVGMESAASGSGPASSYGTTSGQSPYSSYSSARIAGTGNGESLPVALLLFPPYLLLCFLLSLDALRRIEPSGRVMGDLARLRARPWLVGTSILQIVVTMLVSWALFWLISTRRRQSLDLEALLALGWFDIVIASLIGLSILLLGRAVVSYEIFTGKTLPRQGLKRHWRNAITVSAGYSMLLGATLAFEIPPFAGLMIAALLVVVFYAMLNWRSYVGRRRYLEHLRPFIGSSQFYDRLVRDTSDADAEGTSRTFVALCTDVLGARRATLVASGPMAPLAGEPLTFPEGSAAPGALPDFGTSDLTPSTLCLPVDPATTGGAVWGIPLWSERGLIGMLLLGEKLDGGLYTQEEIEIARATGERLLDLRAGAEVARRLMELQRRRLVETQLLDSQTRRVLHDDVLPMIHSTMLSLRSGDDMAARQDDAIVRLTELHRGISDLLRSMPIPATQQVERLGLQGALRQVVDVELRGGFDEVRWQVDSESAETVASLPPLISEVVFYAAREAIRNSARYGRGSSPERSLSLTVRMTTAQGLAVIIEDDGVGVERSTESRGGSGQGLALHGTMMAVVGGSLSIESVPESHTRVTIAIPDARYGQLQHSP